MRYSRYLFVLAAASLSFCPASALAQHGGAGGGGAPVSRDSTNTSNSNLNLPDVQKVDDRKFLQDAAMSGLTEVALGKLAVDKGSSDAVKQFGQKMIDDHTKANDELKQLATAGGMKIPDELDAKHQSRVDKLAKLSGAEFDKAFIKDQQKYHQQNVREFQDEAKYGAVPQVKDLATKSLPTLEQHLELAKNLSKK